MLHSNTSHLMIRGRNLTLVALEHKFWEQEPNNGRRQTFKISSQKNNFQCLNPPKQPWMFLCNPLQLQIPATCVSLYIFVSIHTCLQCVHTNTPTPPLAVAARLNMSIVQPARQALIPECLQAAEGKELKVSVSVKHLQTHTYKGR